LAGKADGQFITVRAVGPHGSLQARRLSNGAVRFYWRYTYRGECRREEIGTYDNRLPPKQLKPLPGGGWTMVAAAAQAASLALLHDDWLDRGGYRAFVLAQERERAAQADQQATEAQASLQALVTAYWEHLRDAGRTSWRDVRNGLTLHVIKAHPELCVLPAKSITTRDILVVLRAIHAKGIILALSRFGCAHRLAPHHRVARQRSLFNCRVTAGESRAVVTQHRTLIDSVQDRVHMNVLGPQVAAPWLEPRSVAQAGSGRAGPADAVAMATPNFDRMWVGLRVIDVLGLLRSVDWDLRAYSQRERGSRMRLFASRRPADNLRTALAGYAGASDLPDNMGVLNCKSEAAAAHDRAPTP
jgi:hypothetical protein